MACSGEQCEDTCEADFNQDGVVDGLDFGIMLVAWGDCQTTGCPEDFNADGVVDGIDLGLFLVQWGPCP